MGISSTTTIKPDGTMVTGPLNTVNGLEYSISKNGQVAKARILDVRDLTRTDPETGKFVGASISDFLISSSDSILASPSSGQGGVDRIILRSKSMPRSSDSVAIKSNANFPVTSSKIAGTEPPTDIPVTEYKSKNKTTETQRSSEWSDNINGTSGIQESKTSDPFGMKAPEGAMYQSIGGADLSVFFMTEVPVMDDVLNPNITPDTWRKQTIIFEIDSVMSISYSTLRERFPVRQLGKSNPVAYTSGPRTIAGHIAFAVLTEDVLTRLRSQVKDSFTKAIKNIDAKLRIATNKTKQNIELDEVRSLQDYYSSALNLNSVQLLDSLPPFNLLVMGMNEHGAFSKFIVKEVRIIDEAQHQGTQQPNIINKVSYVAEDIVPMSTYDKNVITGSIDSITEQYQYGAYSIVNSMPNLPGSNLLDEIDKDMLVSNHN